MKETEMRNESSLHIDEMSVGEMLEVIQRENVNAVNAVGAALPSIERAVCAIEPNMRAGGRLIYVGCGTSGRLGVLDAAECPPTFGVSAELVVGIIAGGDSSLRRASEGAEDDRESGARALKERGLGSFDCVVGISAAGGAEFVIGALEYASSLGCVTVAITNNPDTEIERLARFAIVARTGAEVVTGSTRMKAGTAQKLILNMLSTSLMIRLGYVYENLMINLRPSNKKLRERVKGIVCELADCGSETAETALEGNGWEIRGAVDDIKGRGNSPRKDKKYEEKGGD